MGVGRSAARAGSAVLGAALLAVGIALLVLPGPGLLLVLAGLVVLAQAFPTLQRYVGPVRERALLAAEQSVSSPLRIAFSVLTAAALIGAGVVWGLAPHLPLGGWSTGSSLILSGLVLLGLLAYSRRRISRAGGRPGRAGSAPTPRP